MASEVVETQCFLSVIACNAFYHCLTTNIFFSYFIQLWGETAVSLECKNNSSPEYSVWFWFLLKDWNYHSSLQYRGPLHQKKSALPEVRTNVTCALQKLHFKVLFWKKALAEQYFYFVSGTFIMPLIIIGPSSNRNFIRYSNWWAESFSSHNKWSSTGFISRTTMVSSGQSFIFNFWLYEMQMHDLSF